LIYIKARARLNAYCQRVNADEDKKMFIDDVVMSGLIVVGGTLVFLSAVAIFIYQDAHNKKQQTK